MTSDPSLPLKYRHSILIIDDEESILNTIRHILANEDYEIHTACNGLDGLNKLRAANKPFSLIISDQQMPVMTGVQFFAQIKDMFPEAGRILVTGYANTDAIIDAINKGGINLYLTKPWRNEELLFHIKQSLSKTELLMENKRLNELIRKQNDELLELNKYLHNNVKKKTADLLAKTEALKSSYEKSQIILDGTVRAMSKIVESRDPYTSGHQERVAKISCSIAQEMTLSKDQTEAIRIAATLHDIGKISVPSEILSKPGCLSEMEMGIIKTHCKAAYDILNTIIFSYPIAEIIWQHHERLNGSGYPRGLVGNAILLEARIIGIADVIEAMSSHRPYRAAFGIETAIEEVIKYKEILYDAAAVEACQRIYKMPGKSEFIQGAKTYATEK
jgi:putative two-component system response regulator